MASMSSAAAEAACRPVSMPSTRPCQGQHRIAAFVNHHTAGALVLREGHLSDLGPQHCTPGCRECLTTTFVLVQSCLKMHGVTHCACDTPCPQSPANCECMMYAPFDVAGPDCEAQLENRKSTLWRPCGQSKHYIVRQPKHTTGPKSHEIPARYVYSH